ncbi:ATP-dependent RNA helicase RhlE [Chryseobacterium sp. RU37D]|uniref:DEAD/DEAH box helicase n=1 Tax=Chryseobacterium sp. RU37D TaxID=1907397 RepID=UPI000953A2FD|nr:DEAD/DEAH box helicase [Chryseobacterium sp. RU37D]SIQ87512.1 ATP-dependent RNA helicase RhlE [Chryseobacterium sp. RU37D]
MISFKNLRLINPIIRAVTEAGYSKPTDIQNAVIPSILEGKDLLASAPKGSGKKSAFAVPILQLLKRNPTEHTKIRVLVLAPTDQSALEIQDKINLSSKYLTLLHLCINGELAENQLAAFRKRVDVLIATPEGLLEIVEKRPINFSQVEILVLYDADKMLEKMVNNIIKNIRGLIPKNIQTLIFCTKTSDYVRKYVSSLLRNPVEISIEAGGVTIESISQCVYFVEKRDKSGLLIDLLKNSKIRGFLVFTHSKYIADELVQQLEKAGINTGAIHGNRSQIAKNDVLDDFKTGKIQILITTDIAAKGIDLGKLLHIVNYDLPTIPQTYVQRIDRVRKSGSEGSLISFCTADEHMDLKNIQGLIGFTMPVGTF